MRVLMRASSMSCAATLAPIATTANSTRISLLSAILLDTGQRDAGLQDLLHPLPRAHPTRAVAQTNANFRKMFVRQQDLGPRANFDELDRHTGLRHVLEGVFPSPGVGKLPRRVNLDEAPMHIDRRAIVFSEHCNGIRAPGTQVDLDIPRHPARGTPP